MARLNGSVGHRSSLFDMKKIHSFIHSFISGGLPYT